MSHELLIAVLAGLGGMLGWGFADFFAKKSADSIGSIASLVWAHVFGTLLLGGIALFSIANGWAHSASFDLKACLWLLFFGVLQAIIYLLVYEGFKKGLVSVLNPIFASFSGIVALISILFLGEVAGPAKFFALLIVFAGIVLINTDMQTFTHRRFKLGNVPGLIEILAATVLASFWTIGWNKFVTGHDWVIYTLFMYLFMTLAAVVVAFFFKADLQVKDKTIWKFLVGIGVGETVAYLAITLGYSSTSLTSIVALISGAFSLPTIFLAHSFLKERVSVAQRAGSLVIIVGVVILSMIQ